MQDANATWHQNYSIVEKLLPQFHMEIDTSQVRLSYEPQQIIVS